jgi:KRAB domain-containing zinc finger protein
MFCRVALSTRYDQAIPCDECGRVLGNGGILARHMQAKHPTATSLSCDVCLKRFWAKTHLRLHMRTHFTATRSTVKPHECTQCGKKFRWPSWLANHVYVAHEGGDPEGIQSCPHCDLTFHRRFHLLNHMRKHTGERPFPCPDCDKHFATALALKCHRARHRQMAAAKDGFRCEQCDKVFPLERSLKEHSRIHRPDTKTWHCDVCSFSARSRSKLKLHRFTHSGEKSCVCAECGNAFFHATALRLHMKRMHADTKAVHKCGQCEKFFTDKSHLKRHEKLHVGVRAHKCDLCKKSFVEAAGLQLHRRLVHKIMPYQCDQCTQGFRLKDELRCHADEKHPSLQILGDEVPQPGGSKQPWTMKLNLGN